MSNPSSTMRLSAPMRRVIRISADAVIAYLLKIRVADMADFNRLHGEVLIALPEVRQARTFFVMKEVEDGTPFDF